MFAALILLASAGPTDDPLPPADPALTSGALEHHVRFLASDELLGRAAGTPESVRASEYLRSALARAGVTPAGDGEGSFFQAVPLVATTFAAAPVLSLDDGTGEQRLTDYGVDFSVRVYGDPKDAGPLRVLVVRALEDLPAEPDPDVALVMESSRARSTRWLDERGHEDGAGWGLVVRVRPDKQGRSLDAPRPSLVPPQRAKPDGPEHVTVNGDAAARLWGGEIETITLVTNGERRTIDERNVVGLVRGVGTEERPELKDEVIVLSAHYDHVGVLPGDPDGDEDLIRNGADDDASGTAVLLELAEAIAAGPRPARTVLFLFCAAEERGMLGTHHWADNPTVPLEGIVCNLNLEMLGMPDPLMPGPGKPWLTGFERSNLGPSFREHGLDVGEDLRPEQSFFTRSDNIVFVRKGIVGQTLSTGGDNPNYHRVTDEADTLDYEHMLACARIALGATRLLADGTITPTWNEGEPKLGR